MFDYLINESITKLLPISLRSAPPSNREKLQIPKP